MPTGSTLFGVFLWKFLFSFRVSLEYSLLVFFHAWQFSLDFFTVFLALSVDVQVVSGDSTLHLEEVREVKRGTLGATREGLDSCKDSASSY